MLAAYFFLQMNSSLEVERHPRTPTVADNALGKANEGRGYSSVGKITAMNAREDPSSVFRIHIKSHTEWSALVILIGKRRDRRTQGVHWPVSLA